MKRPLLVMALVISAMAAAAGFAVNRFVVARSVRADRQSLQSSLSSVVQLASEHPRAFGSSVTSLPRESTLKTLVQETATSRNVSVGYLSENDRETDRGRRERQVIIRLEGAAHPNLIRFLEDLERLGAAKVKEIHVRPSRSIPNAYEEAEVVLSRTTGTAEEKKQ